MRLYHGYGIDRLHSVLGVRTRRAKVSLLGKFWFIRGLINYNSIWKPTLLKRGDFSNFRSLHSPNLSQSARHLLPIQHFRFAGSLYQKIRMGLRKIATTAVPLIISYVGIDTNHGGAEWFTTLLVIKTAQFFRRSPQNSQRPWLMSFRLCSVSRAHRVAHHHHQICYPRFSMPVKIDVRLFYTMSSFLECIHARFMTWDPSFMRFRENMVNTLQAVRSIE